MSMVVFFLLIFNEPTNVKKHVYFSPYKRAHTLFISPFSSAISQIRLAAGGGSYESNSSCGSLIADLDFFCFVALDLVNLAAD